MLQDALQFLTRADNLVKMSVGANFILEIQLFLGELVREFRDPAIGKRIFHSNGHLARDSGQELDLRVGVGMIGSPTEYQEAQGSVSTEERQHADRLEACCQ